MLTLFTCPKPFRNHIGIIQANAIHSWLDLGPEVEVILVGDEPGMAEIASATGVRQLSGVELSGEGTPLASSVFRLARANSRHEVLCYLNADIVLLDDFLPAVHKVQEQLMQFLIVGQRWDLRIREAINFETGWQEALRRRTQEGGRRHPPAGSDYFVFRRDLFLEVPPFALGRAGWDNWMIFAGRAAKVPVVDASAMITAIHQDHDYSHLPDGQPHYRLPESLGNIELAGGREMIFRLTDADWRLTQAGLEKKSWRDVGIQRWMESKLVSSFGPGHRARVVRMAFHPLDTMRYLLTRLRERLDKLIPSLLRRGPDGP